MTSTITRDAETTTRGSAPFSALTKELLDLDFLPEHADDSHVSALRHEDLPTTVVIDQRSGTGTACITHLDHDGTVGWQITFTAATPDVTQIVALYGAINPDPQGAIESIASAYNISPWQEGSHLTTP
ncbi:hypothetical protein [Longispora urticae]